MIRKRNRTALYLILPALIMTFFVHLIPIIWGIIISFQSVDIKTVGKIFEAPFVGIQNYIELFTSEIGTGPIFVQSLLNIIIFGLITVPIGFILSLGIALLLNTNFKGSIAVKGLILLPYITPDAVIFNVWRFMFQSRIGIINKIFLDLGFINEPMLWLVGDNSMIPVIISSIWKGLSLSSLILLAGLQSIPNDLYEAAKIDGASGWQQFKGITIPAMKSTIMTMLLLNIIWTFHAFNQFYVLLGKNPGLEADVPSTVILREAVSNLHYSLGSAMSTIVLFVILILVFIFLRLQKKDKKEV